MVFSERGGTLDPETADETIERFLHDTENPVHLSYANPEQQEEVILTADEATTYLHELFHADALTELPKNIQANLPDHKALELSTTASISAEIEYRFENKAYWNHPPETGTLTYELTLYWPDYAQEEQHSMTLKGILHDKIQEHELDALLEQYR